MNLRSTLFHRLGKSCLYTAAAEKSKPAFIEWIRAHVTNGKLFNPIPPDFNNIVARLYSELTRA